MDVELSQPAHQLLARLHRGELSAYALTQACLARIDAENPRLNAVPVVQRERALSAARAADRAYAEGGPRGPLHGLPMTVKDFTRVAACPSSYGYRLLKHYRPRKDSAVVAALKGAGAIILGRSNVPVGGVDWQCLSGAHGRTLNPHDTARTCGGSSGGAAAALAAGMTPLEIGSDLAGSIRYPAHCCGVMGLRPSDGLVSNAGMMPGGKGAYRHSLVNGPMARCVEDLELALRVIAEPGKLPADTPKAEPAAWRIAWADSFGFVEAGAETAALLRGFAADLAHAGLAVNQGLPAVELEALFHLHARLIGADALQFLPAPLRGLRSRRLLPFSRLAPQWERVDQDLAGSVRRGFLQDEGALAADLAYREEAIDDYEGFFAQHDFWVTPVSPAEALAHHPQGAPIEYAGRRWEYPVFLSGFLSPSAVLGGPTLVMPLGRARSGLPIGVQIHARRGDDLKLLAFGRWLQASSEKSWAQVSAGDRVLGVGAARRGSP
ncbi:amidase [Alkalilimnicola sp. S0819]|uniref:amidase n=1 Tax=Alkalilimnicola sp. S0819 TaxID=2613922 RepID=UPI0012616C44|nr:amidase family protein [Alkalilimnicola sp. S0819]KAB7623973.1 hypothetical protein F3N43_07980 [Alkalilimnicola sp. S0819]MPQ16574.1 hypothetical protein [Alkalilimnicola sp. S0819]